jgi:hypothetical protein
MAAEGDMPMTDFSGSFSGRVRVLTTIALADIPGHELQTVEISGPQSSSDANWNGAQVTYWGVSDVVAGNGAQRGYYVNERRDGSRDWGTFEGKVTTDQGGTVIDGVWRFSDGTGQFAGCIGQGTYKTRMTSPTELECTWQGRYELAEITAAA